MTENIEPLHLEHSMLTHWLTKNALEKVGTVEYRKKLLTHRLLTDLIANDGGTPEERAEVMRRINDPDFGKIE